MRVNTGGGEERHIDIVVRRRHGARVAGVLLPLVAVLLPVVCWLLARGLRVGGIMTGISAPQCSRLVCRVIYLKALSPRIAPRKQCGIVQNTAGFINRTVIPLP